jgi:hypothetical protein
MGHQLISFAEFVRSHGPISIICGIDSNGNVHYSDLGLNDKTQKAILKSLNAVNTHLVDYFKLHKLKTEKTYIIKIGVEFPFLTTEYFPEIPNLFSKKVGGVSLVNKHNASIQV